MEHRRDAETRVGQQAVAAPTQTPVEVSVVAFESLASAEEQDAFASAEKWARLPKRWRGVGGASFL